MKKILVPTEFSAHASQIFLYALELAKTHKASITLLHAFHGSFNPKTSWNEMGNMCMENLYDFVAEHQTAPYKNIVINCEVMMGEPTEAILKTVEEEEIDCIVMGMKGKTNALEGLFGGIAQTIVNKVNIPVLFIPATMQYRPIESIAYGFDFTLVDLIETRQLINFFQNKKLKVTCIHFDQEEEDWFNIDDEMAFLEDMFKHHPDYKNFQFDTITGNFKKDIQEYLLENKKDLLVLVSHSKSKLAQWLLPNNASYLTGKISVPLLVLKEQQLM